MYNEYLDIMEGIVPEPENWEDVLQEYNDLIKTDKSENVFELIKKINIAAWRLGLANEVLSYMKKYDYDHDYAEALVGAGFDFIEPSEGDQLWKQILRVENEAKAQIVLLNQYNAEYRRKYPESKNEEKMERMDYLKELNILSKFIGYRIKSEETTLYDFGSIVNTFIDYNKQMKDGRSNNSI